MKPSTKFVWIVTLCTSMALSLRLSVVSAKTTTNTRRLDYANEVWKFKFSLNIGFLSIDKITQLLYVHLLYSLLTEKQGFQRASALDAGPGFCLVCTRARTVHGLLSASKLGHLSCRVTAQKVQSTPLRIWGNTLRD